jgi:hypothetical protein
VVVGEKHLNNHWNDFPNPDSPFNPDYKQEKKFLRKSNKRKIIMIVIILCAFLFGSIDYMNKTITKIEMKTVTGKIVIIPQFIDGECHLLIKNDSPYDIKLIISDGIETNYNDEKLLSGVEYYYWFKSNITESLEIRGVKS